MNRVGFTSASARLVVVSLATLAMLLAGEVSANAADPLTEYGLVLPNGRVASPPPASVWGAQLDPTVRAQLERRARRLQAEPGRVWISWDAARMLPRELILSGVEAPGAVNSAFVAELFARLWLARHIELLAPGSTIDDFELVGNDLSAGLRSVGFRQLHDGAPVVGGQISLIFADDARGQGALVHVGAHAIANVSWSSASAAIIPIADAQARARDWLALDYGAATLRVLPGAERVWLPVWQAGQQQVHDVLRVELRSDAPAGHWAVYVDAHTGAPVAREQLLRSAGTLRFNVPTRHPLAAREDALAPELNITESGNPKTTDLMGQFSLSNNPSLVLTSVAGPRVSVNNVAGAEATTNLNVSEGGTGIWNDANNEFVDAQLSAFVHASRGKSYVRNIDPQLAWLDEVLPVDVNLNGSCNAFADAQGIHFFRESNQCANMGRLADVVIHELGHRVHGESMVEGVGAFDGALSEGVSDYLPATMTNDSAMGRGFYKNDQPLREINPPNVERVWPDDISNDPHMTGLIIAGTLWDLRAALITELGMEAGVAQADHLYYQAHRRAVDIPSMYAQTLLADDDNGDLSDGTPHICMINEVFANHGLLELDQISDVELDVTQKLDGYEVVVAANLPMLDGCADSLESLTLRWRLRDDPNTIEDLPMQLANGVWVASIPTQPAGTVVEYRIEGLYGGGTDFARPLNIADPWYQAYFGAVEKIYCLDANADPNEWTLIGDLWSFGALMPGGGDPTEPYDDDGVQLSMDGTYTPDSDFRASTPVIDITGYDDVRLHYYRWLSVEDDLYDHASIRANGQVLWNNLGTMGGQTQHLDGEWRFHDVELAEFIPDGQVSLQFRLTSDPGLEFGGWNIDALCVVAVSEPVCGDGEVGGPEECDDGNTVDGDGCDAQCQLEDPVDPTGDGDGDGDGDPGDGDGDPGDGDGDGDPTTGVDTDTDTDTGGTGDTGTSGDPMIDGDDGCNCSTSTSDDHRPWAAAWLLMLAGLGASRRRRR